MRITVIGSGYVGLVTGVCLAEIGHTVTCIDKDSTKIEKMQAGIPPIYEPHLAELLIKNSNQNRLFFTIDLNEGFKNVEVIYIAVGTPEREDGSCDLSFVNQVLLDIAENVSNDVIVVTKSTVPVGTNEIIKKTLEKHLTNKVKVDVASNPEFLREGSAIYDTLHGERIIIGTDNDYTAEVLENINKPFGIPIFKTDIRNAELIKYATNAFLATKISFINEISNICERLGADVGEVAYGIGLDSRIESQFLNAGIGYGGSCFPKDTKSLVHIAEGVGYHFNILKSVIEVNQRQQEWVVDKLITRFDTLSGMQIAVLGLAFKPNTADMRNAASIVVIDKLIQYGANVRAYDPVAMENAKKALDQHVSFANNIASALLNSDAVVILTEWEEIKDMNNIPMFVDLMKSAIIFDGRNCFELDALEPFKVEYHSIGRPSLNLNICSQSS